jgi:diguanylate cyclase (GGDEF)-like protein
MVSTPSSRSNLAQALRRAVLRLRNEPRANSIAARVEIRLLAVMLHHLRFQLIAGTTVLLATLVVARPLSQWPAVVGIAAALGLMLGIIAYYWHKLRDQIARGEVESPIRRRLAMSISVAVFLWGALTWPLEVGRSIDFASFLIVVIVLFSVCLSILSAGFHRKTMIGVAGMGALSIGAKIVALTPVLGWILPMGFAVYLATLIIYALVIEHQARAAVLLELRNERASQRLAKANQALEQANAAMAEALGKAQRLADHDSLTDLRNRRAFERDMIETIAAFPHRELGLLLADIDYFKRINDRFGHETGDGVLIAVATCLRQWEREATGRLVGRWGGEEFIIVVAQRGDESLERIAEDLRHRIATLADALHWPDTVALSASIGAVALAREATFDDALQRADAALYAAKSAGRNCWKLAA